MEMKFKTLISQDDKIIDVIKRMGNLQENKFMAGIAIIVDSQNKIIGSLSDGDLRRGLSLGVELDSKVKTIANFKPLTIIVADKKTMKTSFLKKVKARNSSIEKYDKVILTKEDGEQFHDVVWSHEIIETGIEHKTVSIYGMGFVGLTLSCIMAKAGYLVKGVDVNEKIIQDLKQNRLHFFENGLESMLKTLSIKNPIEFTSDLANAKADIHIISVGTPVKTDQTIDMAPILAVTNQVSANLQQGDTVIYRSTLPVGTTRKILLPILEKSGLIAGKDFYLIFCPERTIEGDALRELEHLPQIVGGINKRSVEIGAQIFRRITPVVVEVESLEAAEMIKLMNNTFRDLVFAFSNEVSKICDELNINAFRLIEAANEGYPRNKIPKPSPGVGGMCLTKDPYLYSSPVTEMSFKPVIGGISRKINISMYELLIKKMSNFCKEKDLDLGKCKVFIIGLAFKGYPETSDIRGAGSLEIIERLPVKNNVFIKDFVVKSEVIKELGCHAVEDILDGFIDTSIVLIMNNHYLNNKFDMGVALGKMKKPGLLFDGWNMFNQDEVESYVGIKYGTLGYISKNG